jgi:spermidine synthase
LWLDDVLNVQERDEFVYHEMISHVPMMTHPDPKRVLIVGGGDGGVATEVMKHPGLEKVTVVEIDEDLVNQSRKQMEELFSDSRLEVVLSNAAEYVKTAEDNSFDVIIIDYTYESDLIMKDCNRILASNGVLTSQSVAPMRQDKEVVRRSIAPMQDVFTKERTFLYLIPTDTQNGQTALACCFKEGVHPEENANRERVERFRKEKKLKYYNYGIHMGAFELPNYYRETIS